MKKVLSIAGSDCSGGAGIQADIKTMTMNGVYGMTAVTALTAQNTMGVQEIFEVSDVFLKKQLCAVFDDIFPDAVKVGMVASKKLIYAISDCFKEYGAKNIVTDPVMVSTSGSVLLKEEAVNVLIKELFPISKIVTPNIYEAEMLCRMKIENEKNMEEAARYIGDNFGCGVLVKGGHKIENANDVLYEKGRIKWFKAPRIQNDNTHGTGCTLSSAIAAGLAKNKTTEEAVQDAKNYVRSALEYKLDIGKGKGPLNHFFALS